MEEKKISKIKEREIWADVFRNPLEYIHSIRYVVVALACAAAVVVIQVACSLRK